MTEAFLGSGINVTMDTSGNVFFRRSDGGVVILQCFLPQNCWYVNQFSPEHRIILGNEFLAPVNINHSCFNQHLSSSPDRQTQLLMWYSTQNGATTAIHDRFSNKLRSGREIEFGCSSKSLNYTVDNLTNAMTNAASARSRVLDTDYAKETAELARAQIIQQAATAMLAQANQQPQIVLALLQ